MNISGLKPFRDYSEHDVLNVFATTGALEKGTLVAISSALGNTNTFQRTGTPPATPYQTVNTTFGNAPSYAYVVQGKVAGTVKKADPTDTCIGMLLYDVRDTNSFGESFRYRPSYERAEHQVSLIGEATPIVKRGTFLTNNLWGTLTNVASSGFIASGGKGLPLVYSKSTAQGQILTNADADGFCLISLHCA